MDDGWLRKMSSFWEVKRDPARWESRERKLSLVAETDDGKEGTFETKQCWQISRKLNGQQDGRQEMSLLFIIK